MKRVANWFKTGLVLGFIWVFFSLLDTFAKIAGADWLYEELGFLIFMICVHIIGLAAKFFLLGSGIFFMLEKVMEYDRQKEEEKSKFEFENTKQQ